MRTRASSALLQKATSDHQTLTRHPALRRRFSNRERPLYTFLNRINTVRPTPGITSRRVLCGGLVHAVLDGHFNRILILSPICPRDLR